MEEFLENTFRSWTIQKEGNLYWNPSEVFVAVVSLGFVWVWPQLFVFAFPGFRENAFYQYFTCGNTLPCPGALSKTVLFRGQYTVYNCSLPCPGALSKTGTFSWPVHCQKLHFSSPVHCLQLLFPVPSTLSKNYPLPCPVHCSTIVICRGQYTVKQVLYIPCPVHCQKIAICCGLYTVTNCPLLWPVHCKTTYLPRLVHWISNLKSLRKIIQFYSYIGSNVLCHINEFLQYNLQHYFYPKLCSCYNCYLESCSDRFRSLYHLHKILNKNQHSYLTPLNSLFIFKQCSCTKASSIIL